MSRWLKSTTQKAYTVQGKIIPPCVTSDNRWLKITESEYSAMKAMPVISSLIKAGGILVSIKEPEELKNSIEGLKGSNAELIAINTQLEEKIKLLESNGSVDVEAIRAEARAEAQKDLQDKQQALDDALAQLAEYKAKYEEE